MNLHIHNTFNVETRTIGTVGVEPYIWDDSESHANYTLATDPSIIDSMIETAPDYKSGRDYLKVILLTNGVDEETAFNNVTSDHKVIYAIHKLGTENQRITTLEQSNHIPAMVQYKIKTTESRLKRAIFAETCISNELPNEKMLILGAAQTVFENYQNYGFEGLDQGDSVDGVDDYINGKNAFAGNGLIDTGYNPITMSLSDLCELLTDLLMKGKYS